MNLFEQEIAALAGTVIGGRYRLVGPLGAGGMSTVWLADDLKLAGKRWAVKRTREQGVSELSAAREAAVLMALNHPYLPHVVDFFPADPFGYSYLVMEYIDGVTLEQLYAQRGGKFACDALTGYAIQLCELLQYLHELPSGPVIFRDIKPSNIMIDRLDHVRLIDFGIARRQSPQRIADTIPLGTIGFAAPELLEQGCSDSRSDLYSLGATLYYLLSGGKLYSAVREPLRLGDDANRRALADVVARLLAEDPLHRPGSAAEVKAALAQSSRLGRVGEDRGGRSSAREGGTAPAAVRRRMRIAVGALYSGAGATFTALAIAALTGEMGFDNAVIEHPGVRPDVYGLLNGERNAPPGYRYGPGRMEGGATPWKQGRTEWHPLIPGQQAEVPLGNVLQQLYRLDATVTIIDIGDRWQQADVDILLQECDCIVAVADPQLSRWLLPEAREHAARIMQLEDAGKKIAFIANKAVSFSGRNEWLDSFPRKPSAVVSCFPYEDIIHAQWKGMPVQQVPGVKAALQKSLANWLDQTIRDAVTYDNRHAGSGLLKKWFRIHS